MIHPIFSILLLFSGMLKMVECGFYIFIENRIFFTRILIISKIPESALIHNQDYKAFVSRFRQWVNVNQFFTSGVTGYTSCPLWYHCIINIKWFVSCTTLNMPINWAHFSLPPMSHYWMLSSTELVCLHSLWGSLT